MTTRSWINDETDVHARALNTRNERDEIMRTGVRRIIKSNHEYWPITEMSNRLHETCDLIWRSQSHCAGAFFFCQNFLLCMDVFKWMVVGTRRKEYREFKTYIKRRELYFVVCMLAMDRRYVVDVWAWIKLLKLDESSGANWTCVHA